MLVFDRNEMGIFDVTLSKELRNQGIGTIFMKQLLNIATNKNVKQVYLAVMSDNKPANHLYEKIGFEKKYSYCYRVLI